MIVRPRLAEDPYSRLAIWARRTAFFSFLAAFISIVIVRSGFLDIGPSLVTFGGALALALLAILLGLAAIAVIWFEGLRGLSYALGAVAIGGALIAYPAYLGVKAYKLPRINDITTDPIDPPRFERIARLRSRNANPVDYAGLYVAERQRSAYPDVEALILNAPAKAAYEAALSLISKRKWLVIDAQEPVEGRRDGHIEAVARSLIMGFRDDIVIRVRTTADGTRVDMRSASRYGQHDFGSNAARITSLLSDIEDAADARARQELERKPAPREAPKTQPPARR